MPGTDKPEAHHHPNIWLLLWRGLLAVVGLYVVMEKPLFTVLVSLAVLGLLLLTGEAFHRYLLQLERRRLFEERQRVLKQQKAEEARLRYERMQAARGEKKSLFGLNDDGDDAPQDGSVLAEKGKPVTGGGAQFQTSPGP